MVKHEGTDRRERYRLGRECKVLVTGANRKSEVASVQNMTRTGLFFVGFGDYQPGTSVEIILPFEPSAPTNARAQHAEVIRVQEIEGSLRKGVALKLLNIFLKP